MRVMIKPAGDAIVRDPRSMTPLKKEGQMVNLDSFWIRRLKSGEIVKVEHKNVTTAENNNSKKN